MLCVIINYNTKHRDEQGRLIRFVKAIGLVYYKKLLTEGPRLVKIGSPLVATSDGRLAPGDRKHKVARSLVAVDWNNLSKYETTTANGRTCAKIPVTM